MDEHGRRGSVDPQRSDGNHIGLEHGHNRVELIHGQPGGLALHGPSGRKSDRDRGWVRRLLRRSVDDAIARIRVLADRSGPIGQHQRCVGQRVGDDARLRLLDDHDPTHLRYQRFRVHPEHGDDRYTQLDEPVHDGDTTYVGGSASGTANVVLGMATPPLGTFIGVTTRFVAKQYVSNGQPGTMNVHAELYNGTTLIATGAIRNLTTTYATYTDTHVVNLSGSTTAPNLRVKVVQDSAGTNKRTSRFTLVDAVLTYVPSDTTAPTAPTGLQVAAASPNQVDLSWLAATDAVAVQGYRVYRNGTQVGTTLIGRRVRPSDSGSRPAPNRLDGNTRCGVRLRARQPVGQPCRRSR